MKSKLLALCTLLSLITPAIFADYNNKPSLSTKNSLTIVSNFEICFYIQNPMADIETLIHLPAGATKACYTNANQLSDLPTSFMKDAFYALQNWMQYVHPQDKYSTAQLKVAVYDDNSSPRAASVTNLSNNPYTLSVNGSNYAIHPTSASAVLNYNDMSGRSNNAFGVDILVSVNASFVLSNYWFDPNPENRETDNAYVPTGTEKYKTDMTSIFLHEIGHGFGIASARLGGTGDINKNYLTPFDVFTGTKTVSIGDKVYGNFWEEFNADAGSPECSSSAPQNCHPSPELFFYGPATVAFIRSQILNITALPLFVLPKGSDALTSQNYSHFGLYLPKEQPNDPALMDPAMIFKYCGDTSYRQENVIMNDMMSGCYVPSSYDTMGFPHNGRFYIQALDLKILEDMDYNIVTWPKPLTAS